jgi:hypothetical protein
LDAEGVPLKHCGRRPWPRPTADNHPTDGAGIAKPNKRAGQYIRCLFGVDAFPLQNDVAVGNTNVDRPRSLKKSSSWKRPSEFALFLVKSRTYRY